MTEYGATRKAWAAHHTADPNPKLEKGCCFLPRQSDGTDRWYSVTYNGPGGRVDSFEMSFAPAVPKALAKQILRREAPADAKLSFDVVKASCEILGYRSKRLSQVGLPAMTAALYRSAAGTGHYGSVVGDIMVSDYFSPKLGC